MQYPQNLREFDRLFAHKEACLRFLEEVRWGGNSFRCQKCDSKSFWALSTGLRRCQSCRFKNSVKAGTIFEASRLPLKMWFYAIWWITAQKSGVNALDLQKDVGLGSYRSAWLLLHKIRSVMASAERPLLEGHVELGEALLGASKTTRVLIAAEFSGPKRLGRIRVEKFSSVGSFLAANVEKDAYLHISGSSKFQTEITRLGFRSVQARATKAPQKLPHVQLVSEQLGRWLTGTLHGRIEAKHLESYLEEFTFRSNWGSGKARGQLFQRVIESAVRVRPLSYASVVSRKAQGHSGA